MKNDLKILYSNTHYLHVEYNQPKLIETKKGWDSRTNWPNSHILHNWTVDNSTIFDWLILAVQMRGLSN
jgi:hypothetical protein